MTPLGMLILDPHNNLLYKNDEAQSIFYFLSRSREQSGYASDGRPGTVPVEVLNFCDKLRAPLAEERNGKTAKLSCFTSTIMFNSEVYSMRGLRLGESREPDESALIIVLIENISSIQRFDLEKTRHEP